MDVSTFWQLGRGSVMREREQKSSVGVVDAVRLSSFRKARMEEDDVQGALSEYEITLMTAPTQQPTTHY